jgi:parallel beta-helix repeat protein
MRALPEMLLVLIAVTILLLGDYATAQIAVKPGERIQSAIDSAAAKDTIEVYSGTYQESLIVNKQLILKGIDSGSGLPRVETENGPAITLKADGIVLEGFWAKSASGWSGDAGILVLSNHNIIRNNMASGNGNAGFLLLECVNNTIVGNVAQGNGNEGISLKNCSRNLLERNKAQDNKNGLKLVASENNQIISNTFLKNRYEAIYLQKSQGNLIEGNYAANNEGGLIMETCLDNIVRKNDFVGNIKGISISYLDANNDVKSRGKGVVISYNSMPTQESVSTNNTIYQNNLSNDKNAYDDNLDAWDNGKLGNNYSDFNDPAEGCRGIKICDSEHRIPGGASVDQFPQASPVKIPGRSTGPSGAALQIFGTSFQPGSKMKVNYTAPTSSEVWVGLAIGNTSQEDQYLGQNISGDVVFVAPENQGAYQLLMHDKKGTLIISLPFNVTMPSISATPAIVRTCENIIVSFRGASGQKNDWIGMYNANSSDLISRQNLRGQENGNVTFSSLDQGRFEFNMFAAGEVSPSATSDRVEVEAFKGTKVLASSSHVAPGGTVIVTYWGAPSSGSGIIGMYGINRPDKFALEKRALGSKNCGRMTWRLPYNPGQYDFRMFRSDITSAGQGAYQLLGQTNVVTVG